MKNVITPRLALIPFTLEMAEAAIIGQSELGSLIPYTISPGWSTEAFNRSLLIVRSSLSKNPSLKGWYRLIIHKTDATLMGQIFIKMIPDNTGSVEVGCSLSPSYQGQEYGPEATKAMINWALCQPGVQSVTAGCNAKNIGAKRSLEKSGLKHIETRGHHLIWQLRKTEL